MFIYDHFYERVYAGKGTFTVRFLVLTIPSAISNAWDEQYAGDMHSLLLTNINAMPRGQPYCSPCPSIYVFTQTARVINGQSIRLRCLFLTSTH
jgi:hypothetical protein